MDSSTSLVESTILGYSDFRPEWGDTQFTFGEGARCASTTFPAANSQTTASG